MYLLPSLPAKLFWVVTPVFPIVSYVVYGLAGLPIRSGEVEHLRLWLHHDNFDWVAKHFRPRTPDADVLSTAADAWIAHRYFNDGDRFVAINLDKLPKGTVGLKYWRFRRLVERVAKSDGIPAVWVSLTAWYKAVSRPDAATYTVVHTSGREAVFSRTWRGKTVFFLSGFDRNEDPPLYFLTQLPRAVASIGEAREALKPGSVVLAELEGRKVFRQGDMFAIPTDLTTADIHAADGVVYEIGHPLYGTAHTATVVADLPDGTQLAWGKLLHIPDGRNPDHKPTFLTPNKWHLVAKNTTPMRLPREGVTL